MSRNKRRLSNSQFVVIENNLISLSEKKKCFSYKEVLTNELTMIKKTKEQFIVIKHHRY